MNVLDASISYSEMVIWAVDVCLCMWVCVFACVCVCGCVCRLRMHLPVFDVEGPCQHRLRHPTTAARGVCGCTRDTHGLHVFSCHAGGYPLARHDRLCDLLSNRVEEVTGNPAPIEQNNSASDDNRRPDPTFQNWRGETRWIDVAIFSLFAHACRHCSSYHGGRQAKEVRNPCSCACSVVPFSQTRARFDCITPQFGSRC